MSCFVKHGSFSITTADGATVAVTGVGFQPKLVIFWLADGFNTAADPYCGTSFGAYDGANQVVFHSRARETTSGTAGPVWSSSHVIYGRSSSAGTGPRYAGASLDADGFTLTRTNAATANKTVLYMAIGGADFSAKVGNDVLPTSNATTKVLSSLGFNPNGLILASCYAGHTQASETAGTSVGGFSIGFASGAAAEAGSAYWSKSQDPSDSLTQSASRVLSVYATFGGLNRQIDLASFGTDELTLNVNGTDTSAQRFGYIAFSAPFVWAGSTTLGTSTGTFDVTSAGFRPIGLLASSSPSAGTLGTGTNNAHFLLGSTDGVTQGGTAYLDVDALTPPDRMGESYTDAILKGYERTGAATFSVESVLAWDSWLSNGVRLNQTDAAPVAGQVALLLIGDSSSGGAARYYYTNLLNGA